MMAMDGPRGSKQCSVDLPHLIAFQDVNPEPKTSRGEDTLFRPAMVKKNTSNVIYDLISDDATFVLTAN